MEEENRRKILLELALHRYDEEVERNEAIDNKNKSMVVFLGVMLTIQCTILIRLIELDSIIANREMNVMLVLFISSFVLNFVSLLYFISTLTYLDKLKSSPNIENIMDFGINKRSSEYITHNIIISLNKCVQDNKIVLKEKSIKEKRGLWLMRWGLVVTTNIYNICFSNSSVRLVSMTNEKFDNMDIDDDSGWFSEPSIEYVIEPDDDKKGILETIKDFFKLMFY